MHPAATCRRITDALRHSRDDERGSISLYVTVMAVGLLLLGCLAFDSSARVRAAKQASYAAAEAARAATQALSADAIAGHEAQIDPSRAATAARAYLAAAGISGNVTVSGPNVTITTSVDWAPVFIPVSPATLHGHSSARIIRT